MSSPLPNLILYTTEILFPRKKKVISITLSPIPKKIRFTGSLKKETHELRVMRKTSFFQRLQVKANDKKFEENWKIWTRTSSIRKRVKSGVCICSVSVIQGLLIAVQSSISKKNYLQKIKISICLEFEFSWKKQLFRKSWILFFFLILLNLVLKFEVWHADMLLSLNFFFSSEGVFNKDKVFYLSDLKSRSQIKILIKILISKQKHFWKINSERKVSREKRK